MEPRRPLIATYMQASRPFGVIYVGMTANLYARSTQHRERATKGFSSDRNCTLLVWYESHELVVDALRREKALKRWNRPWKMQLIERANPDWADLWPFLCDGEPDPRVKPREEDGVEAFLGRLDRGEIEEP
ncbi:GIY-YIG nuclease family protein [Brevundimonas sp.]|jgi:putative endonuclease|uniref:GIY-YIG nuclease family protein n=1 Tax=Brevundimonas sp. TaxID=1871086 RepID=UPI002E115AD7|nr:GIY-YIG nuclease family protein [Brevundimonas sp.]